MAMSQKPGPLGTLSHSWLMDVDSPKFGNFIDNLTHPHILFITWVSKHAVFPNWSGDGTGTKGAQYPSW